MLLLKIRDLIKIWFHFLKKSGVSIEIIITRRFEAANIGAS